MEELVRSCKIEDETIKQCLLKDAYVIHSPPNPYILLHWIVWLFFFGCIIIIACRVLWGVFYHCTAKPWVRDVQAYEKLREYEDGKLIYKKDAYNYAKEQQRKQKENKI